MNIVILSAACCSPGMAALDEQTKKVIERAVKETGVKAEIKIITAAAAIYNEEIPNYVKNNLLNEFSRVETARVPVILINGEVISYGVPQLEDMITVMNNLDEYNTYKKEIL